VPLFDLAYVLLSRWFTGTTRSIGEAITYCGQDHLSHRLVRLGFNRVQAVLFILVLALSMGVLAVAMRNSRPVEAVMLTLHASAIYLLLFAALARAQFKSAK
jgi:UDP-N-acetylmuramyl pentapeptide phosphotransferase/UDP-N-acetylglucosamine-1-phosphate transferase